MSLRSYLGEFTLSIPASAHSLAGFRAWATSDDFPEKTFQLSFIQGEILLKPSPEDVITHNGLKTEVLVRFAEILQASERGLVFADRALLSNVEADTSTEPDVMVAFWETFKTGRLQMVAHKDRPNDVKELEGTPDCVVEIISPSSVRKDTKLLRDAYHRAGIPEYWLLDGLKDPMRWQLLRREANGYVATPTVKGWTFSQVFGVHFKFDRSRDPMGNWRYVLRNKP